MSGVERVRGAFRAARADGRAALIPFLVAGDPDPATSARISLAAAAAGADLIELGLPFSDPLADGPVIQEGYARALAGGVTTRDALACAAAVAAGTDVPVIVMASLNLVLARKVTRFCDSAAAAGVAGLLVPDLPLEDATELRERCARHGIATVFMAAPDSGPERIRAAADAATGFLYLVRRRGVTGEGGAAESARSLRVARVDGGPPVAVGFGVASPPDAAEAARDADGVIVGSALVRAAAEACALHDGAAAASEVAARVRALRAAVRRAASPTPTPEAAR